MKFNPEINLGTIIQLVSFLIAALVFISRLDKRLDKMEVKMNILFQWFERHVINLDDDDTRKFFGDRT